MKRPLASSIPLLLVLLPACGTASAEPADGAGASVAAAQEARFFEMRTYTANEGKFDDLQRRFRDHTLRIFAKHGMTNVGYWVPTDGELAGNTLVYILAYPSREAREESWAAFRVDPEWQAVRAASEDQGALIQQVVSTFLAPTDYSPMR